MSLSKAQIKFLVVAARTGYRTPFTGNRHAGRVASAWYRTAQSLADKGLVRLTRSGDAGVAEATDLGRQVICAMNVFGEVK
jgi:hypothetical protein